MWKEKELLRERMERGQVAWKEHRRGRENYSKNVAVFLAIIKLRKDGINTSVRDQKVGSILPEEVGTIT